MVGQWVAYDGGMTDPAMFEEPEGYDAHLDDIEARLERPAS